MKWGAERGVQENYDGLCAVKLIDHQDGFGQPGSAVTQQDVRVRRPCTYHSMSFAPYVMKLCCPSNHVICVNNVC